jgi:tetratricopeptide (TPR) repeat protein
MLPNPSPTHNAAAARRGGWLAAALFAAFAFLLINGNYLLLFGSPSIFYLGNVGAHLVVGVAASLVFLGAGARVFLVPAPRRALGILAWGSSLAAAITGAVPMWTGGTRPYHWLLSVHQGASWSAVLFVGIWVLVRGSDPGATPAWRRTRNAMALLLPLGLLLPGAARLLLPDYVPERYAIVNPASPPASMDGEGDGPQGPFFPSAAQTSHGGTIPSNFFLESKSCGRSGCHPDVYSQWNESVHHLASFNNQWYRKSIEYMQSVVGTKPSKWCGGCHDHALLFSGKMDTPIEEIVDTPEAQAGLACVSCHSIVDVKDTMGNGGFVLDFPRLHDLATSKNPVVEFLHDYLTEVDPEPHRRVFLKPFHTESEGEFCSACHKVHLDVPVNRYRWFRGFNDYDAWQASAASGQGARSFYYPKEVKNCADCHMPLVESRDAGNHAGKVHSHRFAAANTAVPYSHGLEDQVKGVTAFLQANQVRVDIFGLARPDGDAPVAAGPAPARRAEARPQASFPEAEETGIEAAAERRALPRLTAPLGAVEAALVPGETVNVEVVVRTLGVGHFFPGGTVDAFDVWAELRGTDAAGSVFFWSGRADEDGRGPLEAGAHRYRSLMLDARGNPIDKRNAWSSRSVAYVRLIPPGAADTVHFRMEVPKDVRGPVTLEARLSYRKFTWFQNQWAFSGVRDPAQPDFEVTPDFDMGRFVFSGDPTKTSSTIRRIPDVPTVVMSRQVLELPLAARPPTDRQAGEGEAARTRWNDYGIGLLLQGDLRGAERAFTRVTEIDPGYADGWANRARVRDREGDARGSLPLLDQALALNPDLGIAHFLYGMSLRDIGDYDGALGHLRAAAARYPRDRAVSNQIGRVLFLQGKFPEAIAQLKQTLAVDPEDLQAHYHLMLAYRGAGDRENAAREAALYQRFKADESSQAIAGPYLRTHPEDNNERLPIHEHVSVPLPRAPRLAAAAGSP